MSNNSYSIGDNHIDWSGDFTKVRLADRFDVIWMAASTLMNLVSHLSLREDNNDRGVVYDKLFKEDTVYQKYREGILFQKGGTAIFFSYDVFEKLIINFSQAQGKIKEISCALTSSGYLIGNGPVVFSSWQMEAIYANMRNAENLDMSFGNTYIKFDQDKITISWQGIESIEYDVEKFAAMLDNWKKQVKENEE